MALCLVATAARADMVVEVRVKPDFMTAMMSMAKTELRVRTVIRDDRSRVERWANTPEGLEEGQVEIFRADRHVHWSIYPKDRTYIESVWPDTAGSALTRERSKGRDPYEGVPDSLAVRMRAEQDQIVEVRHLEHDTINGFPVEHVVVTSHPKAPIPGVPSGVTMGGTHDLWIMTSHPHLEEALRLFEVLATHQKLSDPIFASMDDFPNSEMPSPPDSMRGIPVRAIMRMQMLDSIGVAEMAKAPPDTSLEELRDLFDPKMGTMVLSDFEMTALRFEPVDDKEFDLPVGYRRIGDATPMSAPAKPKRKR